MQRQSKKRQAILDCLKASHEHPTAEWIYESLKPDFPDLSLATVYRNLGQLEEHGFIRTVCTVMGKERFDGDIHDHTHAVCIKCGSVTDVADISLPVEENTADGFQVLYRNLQLSGICKACRESEM